MLSAAVGSPTTRMVADIAKRIDRLEKFVAWGNVEPLPLRELAGEDRWEAYWKHLSAIEQAMFAAQREADDVKAAIRQALTDRTVSGRSGDTSPA